MRWFDITNHLFRNGSLSYISIFGGIFMMVLFIVGLGLLIYFIIKNKNGFSSREKTPLEIIKERYAKGEISEEEYNKMRENLNK